MSSSVRSTIERHESALTPTERKVAAAVLADYPFSGLETIQSMGAKISVSAPTITRFVKKLGFNGYQQFQRRLIGELREGQQSPLDLHVHRSAGPASDLASFVQESLPVVTGLSDSLSDVQLQRVCVALGDPRRAVHIIGGRISDSVAQYLYRHLVQIRPGVAHVPPDPERWPPHLLQMRARDVLLLMDFRRYQRNLAELASRAAGRKAHVVLVTDKWLSPVAEHAAEVMVIPVDSGSAWDSYAGALLLMEFLIERVTERDWPATQKRIQAWDALRGEPDVAS